MLQIWLQIRVLVRMKCHLNFFTFPSRQSSTVHKVTFSILISSSPSAAFLPIRYTSAYHLWDKEWSICGWSPTYFRCYVNILLIKYTNVNFTSLYLKKAGLASRNIVHGLFKKITYVVSVFASILYFHLLNRLYH